MNRARSVILIHLRDTRLYVVACAGRRLAVVPESPAPGSAVDFVDWPVQPAKLCLVAGRGGQPVVVVVGEDGSACALAVGDGRLPAPPPDLAQLKPGAAKAFVGACVNGGYVTIVRQLPAVGKKAGSGGECSVCTWAVPQVAEGAARPLTNAAAVRSDFMLAGTGGGEGRERVAAVCAHDGARAVSVVLAGPAKGQAHASPHGRWLKFDCTDGRLLFERPLALTGDAASSHPTPLHASAAGGLLWLVRGGVASAWDPRYGVPVHSCPLPAAARSPLFALVTAEEAVAAPQTHPAPGPGPRPHHYHLTVCVQAAGGVTVLRAPLALPPLADQPLGSLSHALGRLAAPPSDAPPGGAESGARKRAGSAESTPAGGVVGSLPAPAREVLEGAAAAQAAADAAGKRYKGASTLPAGPCEAFLAALAAVPDAACAAGAVTAGDWAAARAVLSGGAVGLERRSPLPRRAAAAGRFDVLQVSEGGTE